MNFLTLLVGIVFLIILFVAAFWIGIYVVLPLALFFCVVSAIVSLIRAFMPKSRVVPHHEHTHHKVIDVEFEEIK